MCEASPSSSAKVLRPSTRESLAPMRTNTPSSTLSLHDCAGTQDPTCSKDGRRPGGGWVGSVSFACEAHDRRYHPHVKDALTCWQLLVRMLYCAVVVRTLCIPWIPQKLRFIARNRWTTVVEARAVWCAVLVLTCAMMASKAACLISTLLPPMLGLQPQHSRRTWSHSTPAAYQHTAEAQSS